MDVWTGATSNLWSVAGNWTLGVPTAGEDLDFPSGAANLTNQNDLSDGTSFNSIEIDSAGYGISGNSITVTNGFSSTFTTGTSQFGLATTLTATETFDVATGGTLDITGVISGGGFGLTKTSGGTLVLAASSGDGYTSTTTVNAGELDLNGGGGMGNLGGPLVIDGTGGSALVKNLAANQVQNQPVTLMGSGATWDLNNHNDNVGLLTFTGGTVQSGTGQLNPQNSVVTNAASTTATISGNFDIHSVNPVILTVAQGTVPNGGPDLAISAVINPGGFTRSLQKNGAGTLGLSGANTYTGGTTINAGVIAISNSSALGPLGSISIANGAELDLSGGITLSRNISFQGTGASSNGALRSVSGNNTYSGTAAVQANGTRIQVDAGQLTLSGNLTGSSLGVNKYGAGVLLVSGSLTSAPILHSVAGDLRINGSDPSDVTLYGGNISGTGTVGSLDYASGSSGTVDPGTGSGTTGTFTTAGGYQVGTGGTTHIDIGGTTAGSTYDQIVNTTSGSVDLTGSNLTVSLVNGFTPAIGDSFEIINNQNSGAVTGTFNNLAEGATFMSGLVAFQVSYAGGNGNDVTLTVIQASTNLTVSSESGTYSGTTTLSATLTSGGNPVGDELVDFYFGSTLVGVGTSDNVTGVATVSNVSLTTDGTSGGTNFDAGTYTGEITAHFAGDSNFTASSGGADLIVNQATTNLTVSSESGTYGGTTTLSATLTSGGNVFGDQLVDFYFGSTLVGVGTSDNVTGVATLFNVSLTTDGTSGGTNFAAGTYTGEITAHFAGDSNFTASSGGADLTVNQATTGFNFSYETGTYGGTITLAAGLVSGGNPVGGELVDFYFGSALVGVATTDNVTGVATLSNVSLTNNGTSGGTKFAAANYTSEVVATFVGDTNYSQSNGSTDLTVNQASLTITADNKSKVYGDEVPTLTASYAGFVSGESSASLTTLPTISTSVTASSDVGANSGNPYPITVSGAADSNYSITYVGGLLTVTQAPLTITADNQTKVYGASLPSLTYTITGFVLGQSEGDLINGPTSVTTTATAASPVSGSPYTITASGAAAPITRSSMSTAA